MLSISFFLNALFSALFSLLCTSVKSFALIFRSFFFFLELFLDHERKPKVPGISSFLFSFENSINFLLLLPFLCLLFFLFFYLLPSVCVLSVRPLRLQGGRARYGPSLGALLVHH